MEGRSATPETLIEVSGLSHDYAGRTVLALDEWCLKEGENQLLLGPSGSGKTTLLSVITGLLKPTAGDIKLCGEYLSRMSPSQKDKARATSFGLVFQDHHLISSLSVEDNLAFARFVAGQDDDPEWTQTLLDRLGLAEKRNSKPATLSRGEAQRAAIARAAITRPPILIADEPTSALDDANTDHVLTLMTDLCKRWGATLLVASHDNRLASYFNHRLDLAGQTGVSA